MIAVAKIATRVAKAVDGSVAFMAMNTNSQKIENDRRGQNRDESRKSRRH